MNPQSAHPKDSHLDDANHADVATARSLLVEHLDLIRGVVSKTARLRGVRGDEQDEFEQFVMVRMLDNDLAILRKFRGDSSLATFLTVVVQRLLLDFRNHRWGRWRPSAKARRLGRHAIQLERMVGRDGRSIAEAVAMLLADPAVRAQEAALEALVAQLPLRYRRRFESDDGLDTMPAPEATDERVTTVERRVRMLRVQAAMVAALLSLPEEDRLLVRLRYFEGLTVPRIARLFELEPKPLYRHFDRQLRTLRRHLESLGVAWASVADFMGRSEMELCLDGLRDRRLG